MLLMPSQQVKNNLDLCSRIATSLLCGYGLFIAHAVAHRLESIQWGLSPSVQSRMWRFIAAVFQKACTYAPTSVLCRYKVMQCAARTAACIDCQTATCRVTDKQNHSTPAHSHLQQAQQYRIGMCCLLTCYGGRSMVNTPVQPLKEPRCVTGRNRLMVMLRNICELVRQASVSYLQSYFTAERRPRPSFLCISSLVFYTTAERVLAWPLALWQEAHTRCTTCSSP